MAASPTSSRGGGGVDGTSCVLTKSSPITVKAAGTHNMTFNAAADNLWDFNPLPGIPSGLGISITLDGVDTDLMCTASGIWAYAIGLSLPEGADTTFEAGLQFPNDQPAISFGPFAAGNPLLDSGVGLAGVVKLPSGAHGNLAVITTVAATGATYTVRPHLVLTRLA